MLAVLWDYTWTHWSLMGMTLVLEIFDHKSKLYEKLEITKVITIHPGGIINVHIKFHGNQSKSCWNISPKKEKKHKCEPHKCARLKVRGSPKTLGWIPWERECTKFDGNLMVDWHWLGNNMTTIAAIIYQAELMWCNTGCLCSPSTTYILK